MSDASARYFDRDVETMPHGRIEAMQETKLRGQIDYLTRRSPLAARKIAEAGAQADDIRTLGDLRMLPFTTKQDLRDSQRASPPLGEQAAAYAPEIVRIHASSGTTGAPSYVGVTASDDDHWTRAVARAYWSQGVRPETVFMMGFSIGFFVGGVPLCNGIRAIGATMVPIGTGATERLIDSITMLKGDALACTPSYAAYLADFISRRQGRDPRELGIRKVLCGAEAGGGIPHVRAKLEESWGATISESIGNADVVPIHSAECEMRDGNHFLVPDQAILEIIDPESGRTLDWESDTLEGEMVFTHIDRQCSPLLRFRTHDRVTVDLRPCACGRSGPRIRVIGRTDDLLILRGVNVWPAAIKDVVTSLRDLTTGEMRILLPEPGPTVAPPLVIEVEHNADCVDRENMKREVERALRDKLIFTADVRPVPPGSLPRTETKAKLIHKMWENS